MAKETDMRDAGMSRRNAMSLAALSAVGAAIPASAVAALPRTPDKRLRTFEGRYAVDSHKIVDGYFVSPKNKTDLDVVMVVPGPGGSIAAARDEAERRALAGAYAVVPALPGDAAAMKAEIEDMLPRLRGLAQGSGKVSFVVV